MKFGFIPINIGESARPEVLAPLVQKAEAVGVESLWTFEHTIVPLEYSSRYPYNKSGKMAAEPETEFVDPLIALAFAAAHSKRVRLATGVNILAQANPLLLAKQAASIDHLSGGRLMLGLGVGWLQEEFRAMGVPFERRGARADDYIVAMKKVWSGEVVEHHSEFLDWTNFKSHPVPTQRPHPPLIIGGDSPAALRRVARLGDGWFAVDTNPDTLKGRLAELKLLAKEAGRDPAQIEISLFWTRFNEGLDSVKRYQDLGVSRLIAPWRTLGVTNGADGLSLHGRQRYFRAFPAKGAAGP
jgi:probable F420-dependent oxidoreductase